MEKADSYLLLLGARYGEPVFDTGFSPTEEEWNVARRRGIPILAFRKREVELEARQAEFVKEVEEYTGGRFRGSFVGPADLQPQVVEATRSLERQASPLVWLPVEHPASVPWIHEASGRAMHVGHSPVLECHLLPIGDRELRAATAV